MLIIMIWGIHDENSLPELLFSMDEIDLRNNPVKFERERDKLKNDAYYENVRVLTQEISDRSLRTFLTIKQDNGKNIRVRLKYK
jgi:hypothetical protein